MNYHKIRGVFGDARKLPFQSNTFDIVLLPEVLEHLEYYDAIRALKEALRVARGYVILTLPNASKKGYDKNLVENPEHRWLPTHEKIHELVANAMSMDGKKLEFVMLETEHRDFIFVLISSSRRNAPLGARKARAAY